MQNNTTYQFSLGSEYRGREMETDLQRVPDRLRLEDVVPLVELVGGAVGQARVEPDVLLLLGEAPEGDPELEVLRHRRPADLYQLEGDRGRHLASSQLLKAEHR